MRLTTLCYIEKDGKYLMLHRVKKQNDFNKDKWIGVGGKFEQNETPEIFVDNPFKFMPAYDNYSKYNTGLHTLLSDYIVQVITGSKSIDDIAKFQKDWNAGMGEDVRADLQAYLAEK